MASITFDRFDLGIDLRKGASVSDANRLLEMKNAYVTTGLATRKRDGLSVVAHLEPGTKGLFAAFGKLHTFSGVTPVAHANTLFQSHVLANAGKEVIDIEGADVFNAFIYVAARYADQSILHHYLDTPPAWVASVAVTFGYYASPTVANGLRYSVVSVAGASIAWAPGVVKAVNDYVRPIAANGRRYKCITAGTTSATEPVWPTASGDSVSDGVVVWQCVNSNTPGAAEPAWPTVIGNTVVDGNITWRAEGTAIADAKCPQSASFIKTASKIFATKGEVVSFCATNAPRDWTTANDAGFLPTGLNFTGAREANALGLYQGKLVVLAVDGAQVWTVDPDPTAMKKDTVVENVGTSYPKSVASVSGDLYFLSDYGFRSITTLQLTNNLADVDVGSPIDKLVRAETSLGIYKPRSFYYYGTGQYLSALGNQLFVYSISRTSKIAAWSRYFLPTTVDAFAQLGTVLYIRSGDTVYKLDPDVSTDDNQAYEVLIQLPYMDFKKPGQKKMIIGADVVLQGKCQFSIGYNVNEPTEFTSPVRVKGNTRPDGMISVCCEGTEFSLRFRNFDAQPFELDSVTIYYEILGAV